MNYYEEDNQIENKYRKKILIGVTAVLLLILAVSAAVLLTFGIRDNKYRSALKAADNLFQAGDYQNAIVKYEEAIKIDKKSENAYLSLSAVYMALGDYTNAEKTIDKGLLLISSDKLEDRKIKIGYLVDNQKNAQSEVRLLTKEEIARYSDKVTIENNAFDMVAAYTYTEYHRDYGNIPVLNEGDIVVVNYAENGFSTFYYNMEKERLIDSTTGKPYATVKPAEVSFENLHSLFNTEAETFAVSFEKFQELFRDTTAFHYDTEAERYYVTGEYKKCRVCVETDENGNIVNEYAWNKLEPLNRNRFEEEDDEVEGEIQGYIQDAMTGKGMKAVLKIRERGKKVGVPLKEVSVGGDGTYVYGGRQGIYTAEISAKGYITEYVDMEIIRGQVKTGKNIVLSPEVKEGEIRIVLTWESSPTDLDSYAIGTDSSGKRFGISYHNKSVIDVGNLDVDDTSGYGPETITITDTGAEFVYSVMDFRLEGTMGGTSAKVKVYLPGASSAVEYRVPSGEGIYWEVFRYKNGELHGINQLLTEVDSVTDSKGGR